MASPLNAQPKAQNLCAVSVDLEQNLFATRQVTQELAAPLSDEDQTVQSCADASPTKWHLAHTTWFFETFVLVPHLADYHVFDARYNYCFNSYYEAQGARQPRADRGLLTRPAAADIRLYRAHVDAGLRRLFASGQAHEPHIAPLVEIGINHEQQHQELLLTDILNLFASNPLRPAYREAALPELTSSAPMPLRWIDFSGGLYTIGHTEHSFAYDNEVPSHRVFVNPFKLADRLVTNGEWHDFMKDGGYDAHHLWLSDGWSKVQEEGWQAPLYWEERDSAWFQMTLHGLTPVDASAPVSHVSYYEADAFARWAGKRLPTEFEWEFASATSPLDGNMLSSSALRPLPAAASGTQANDMKVSQMFGDVWEWTQSAYAAYPGYHPPKGAIGEYNGKFMCSQQVLRGASCVTPNSHARRTYRNFFHPHQRWQFSGLRLADEA